MYKRQPIYPFNLRESEISYPSIEIIIEELNNRSREVYVVDANKIAIESGHPLSMNMVMLGSATAINGFPLKKEIIIDSMKENLPKNSLDINLRAFESGFNFVKSGII